MKLGKLASVIDDYTFANTISVMLNGKVVGLYNREDFYIKVTSELENVNVLKHFLGCNGDTYMIILDVYSFKAVFKI